MIKKASDLLPLYAFRDECLEYWLAGDRVAGLLARACTELAAELAYERSAWNHARHQALREARNVR